MKSALPQFSRHNVNVGRSRLTAEEQFDLLEELSSHREFIAQFLDIELKGAKRMQKTLLDTDEAGLELRGKPSALIFATSIVETITGQLAELIRRKDQTDCLYQPINRCPADVLKLIFESTVGPEHGHDSFKMATSISSVCREWRSIALETPRLWVGVQLFLDRPRETIDEYWERTMQRVKKMPIDLTLYLPPSVDETPSHYLLPQAFDKLQAIDRLDIFLQNCGQFETLNDKQMMTQISVQEMCLIVIGHPEGIIYDIWNVNSWLSKWSLVQSLRLDGRSGFSFDSGTSFPATVELFLRLDWGSEAISLPNLTSTFPNLKTLVLSSIEVLPLDLPNSRIVFESLTEIRFVAPTGPVWRYIRCPRLNTVCQEYQLDENFMEFLDMHRTVEVIQLLANTVNGIYPIREIAAVAPQLTMLKVDVGLDMVTLYDWRGSGLSEPGLPHLKSLHLTNEGELSSDRLVSIIRARCLPITHSYSLLDVVEQRIQLIEFTYDGYEHAEWKPEFFAKWTSNSPKKANGVTRLEFQYDEFEGEGESGGYHTAEEHSWVS